MLSLLSLIVLNIETNLGFFSIKSVISGAKVFFEFPARSYNSSTFAPNFTNNLFNEEILSYCYTNYRNTFDIITFFSYEDLEKMKDVFKSIELCDIINFIEEFPLI